MTMQIKFSKHNSPTVPYMVNRSRVLACDWLQEFALNFSVACRWTKCFGLIFPLLLHKWSKRLSVEMRFFSILYFLMPTWDAARKLRFIFSTGVLSKANNHLVASKLDSQSMVDHIHKVVWSMKLKIYLYWNLIRSQLWLAEFWLYFALIFSLLSISFCEIPQRDIISRKKQARKTRKKKRKKKYIKG